jgi:excinuclease ABC subunit C
MRSRAQVRLFLEGQAQRAGGRTARTIQPRRTTCVSKKPAALRDLLTTVEEMDERQKMAAASGNDADIFGFYAEPPLVAVNLFHLRNGQIVDRRDFFWEDQYEFDPPNSSRRCCCRFIWISNTFPPSFTCPIDFEDQEVMEELLSEKKNRKVEIHTPQARPEEGDAEPRADQREAQFRRRFRVMKPSSAAIQARFRTRWACRKRRSASSASIFRTSRAPTRSPAWWSGKTAG